MLPSFKFSSLPVTHFGPGKRNMVPAIVNSLGTRALVVTGTSSVHYSGHGEEIIKSLKQIGVDCIHEVIGREPSPDMVDSVVNKYREDGIEVVVAIGGGSVMDAGKAISALLTVEHDIRRYLEGVGDLEHPGTKLPMIALPTTSGTGSEMTKNAVISEVGEKGFKKSLRHDNFIPDFAIIDPEMMLTCPAELTATSGMDAFSQLLESYVSTESNPMTDALALQGLKYIKRNMIRAFLEGEQNLDSRSGMALAAMFSGITLAHAGLGLVHGFASPVGGLFEIPHGVVCGRLMAPVFSLTIDTLLLEEQENPAFQKMVIISKVFSDFKYKEDREFLMAFKDKLNHIVKVLEIPALSKYGVTNESTARILESTSYKNHPVKFSDEDLKEIFVSCL